MVWLTWHGPPTGCAIYRVKLVSHCGLTKLTVTCWLLNLNMLCGRIKEFGVSLWSDWNDRVRQQDVRFTELHWCLTVVWLDWQWRSVGLLNLNMLCDIISEFGVSVWLLKWQGSPTGCAIYRVKLVSHCGLTGLTMTCWLTNWLDLLCDGITQSGVSLSSRVVWLK